MTATTRPTDGPELDLDDDDLDLLERLWGDPAAFGFDEGQARDEHGRWTSGGGGSAGSAGTVPTDRSAEPIHPALAGLDAETVARVTGLAARYHVAAEGGAGSHESELETWRFGLSSHTWRDLDALHQVLGLPRTDGHRPLDAAAEIVQSLYAKLGRPVPDRGNTTASRPKVLEARALFARGAGRKDRQDFNHWLRHEASFDEIRWVGEQLGVHTPGVEVKDRSDILPGLADLLMEKTKHPGEDKCEDEDWPRMVREARDGKAFNPIDPDVFAKRLTAAGPAAADYMARVLGVHAPGMDEAGAHAAIRPILAAAGENHGRSPATEDILKTLAALPGGRIESWVERDAMRQRLGKLTWQEQAFLHRNLDLLGDRDTRPIGRDAIKEVVARFTPPIAERIAADPESAAIVGKLAAAQVEWTAAREAAIKQIEVNGAEMVKYYEARNAAAPDEGPAREAWKEANREWRERIKTTEAESETLMEKLGLDRLGDRRKLLALMTPKARVRWKVKNDRPKAEHKTAMEAAMAFFDATLSHPDGSPPPKLGLAATITLRPTKTRARAQLTPTPDGDPKAGIIWLDDGSEATAVHEMGHQVEYHMPGAQAAAQDFLAHRVKDEKTQKLKTLFSGYGYEADEEGRQDDFGKYFGAGDHRAYYCGKLYHSGTTEILSMGVEYLYKDPLGFCQKDPEFAGFIIGVLRGTIR